MSGLDDTIELIFDNNQPLYNLYSEWCANSNGDWTKVEDELKDWLDNESPVDQLDDPWSGILQSALNEINTTELAKSFLAKWQERENYNKQSSRSQKYAFRKSNAKGKRSSNG